MSRDLRKLDELVVKDFILIMAFEVHRCVGKVAW